MSGLPTPPNAVPTPRRGEIVAERYVIRALLGRGGFGEVYFAEDQTLGRGVALKAVRATTPDASDAARLIAKEGKALARLRHPGIVQLYDVVFDDAGAAVLVLEYVPGVTLDEYADGKKLPWGECVRIGAAICDALTVAHSEGVVHRDLKPTNVIIEPDGRVRVTDFGIARIANATATPSGLLFGSPGYIAPELATGEAPASEASDIYALSALLYELATGRPPFVPDNESPGAMLLMHIQEEVPDPRRFAPDLPESAAALLIKGLSKKPAERFGSFAQMGSALTNSAQPAGKTPVADDRTEATKLQMPPGVAPVDLDAKTRIGSSPAPKEKPSPPEPARASDEGGSGVSPALVGGIAAAVLLVGGVAAFAIIESGGDSGAAAGDSGASSVVAPTYTPPAGLTRELRDAGLSPAKFKAACEERNYDKLRWFQRRIDARITCAYHAGINLFSGLPADPPAPKYTVSAANREKLKSDFGMVPSDLRRTCLQIAREFRESSLRGKDDGDTYWEIADKHHSSSIESYTEGKYAGSRLDPCVRFAGLDPSYGAAPYFVADGTADNDEDGLSYDWL